MRVNLRLDSEALHSARLREKSRHTDTESMLPEKGLAVTRAVTPWADS